MDGRSELLDRLAVWAAAVGVTPTWVRGVLRLQADDGTAKVVVSFSDGFWAAFPCASEDRRHAALDIIVREVHALYDPAWKSFEPKVIEVPSVLLDNDSVL